ncbi:MAG: hypothetical protein EBS19_02695 [Spirochaetia bacterium]|nr:hypothetical protein [Spirochaetia bacterium]
MLNLYSALLLVNIEEDLAKKVLTDVEMTIHSEIDKSLLLMNLNTITPIVRDQDGIRNEVHLLSEKMDFIEERLDTKIDSVEERLTAKIDSVEERLTAKFDSLKELFETKFALHDKLLWTIIGFQVAMASFMVASFILIFQKLP